MEIWKQIKGYEGIYEISSLGRVKSLSREKKSKGNGITITDERYIKYPLIKYPHVTLHKKGIKKTALIHRLVAEAFIPNPDNKLEVNHKDGNSKNFSIDNLEWVTKSENQLHAYKFGLVSPIKGEKNILSKLSDKQVLDIREKYKTKMYSQREIAKEFGVSQCRINFIVNNKARI